MVHFEHFNCKRCALIMIELLHWTLALKTKVAYLLQKTSHDMVSTWNDHNLQITRFHPAYATLTYIYDGLSHREAFWSIFTLPLHMLYKRFLSWVPKNPGINTVHLIMAPHLKLFSVCSVTGLPRSSANICHAPGLTKACPDDAMHLPGITPIPELASWIVVLTFYVPLVIHCSCQE